MLTNVKLLYCLNICRGGPKRGRSPADCPHKLYSNSRLFSFCQFISWTIRFVEIKQYSQLYFVETCRYMQVNTTAFGNCFRARTENLNRTWRREGKRSKLPRTLPLRAPNRDPLKNIGPTICHEHTVDTIKCQSKQKKGQINAEIDINMQQFP